MTIKHKKTSAAGVSADPAKVGGDDWNDDHLVDAGGIGMTSSTSVPATPATGNLTLYAQKIGGQPMPAFVTPDAIACALQAYLGRKRFAALLPDLSSGLPSGGNVGFCTFSRASSTGGGVGGSPPQTGTNYVARWARLAFNSGATAGSYVSLAGNNANLWRGGGLANTGGFRMVLRWGCADGAAVAGARSFAGVVVSGFNNVDPSTQLNLVGVGSDSGDSNLSLFCNDGVGAATKIPLGANFPDHTLGTEVYELVLYAAPGGTQISVTLTRVRTGDVYEGVVSTNIPANDITLNPFVTRANGATALSVYFALIHLYLETDL